MEDITKSERCQSLIQMQTARLQRFDKTRSIQWNFNGILWSGILITTSFLIPHRNEMEFSLLGLSIYGVIILSIHGKVIHMIQSSLDFDKGKFIEYTRIIENELGLTNFDNTEIINEVNLAISGQIGKSRKWFYAQLFITFILLASAIYLICYL